ncbi:MAG TPA: sensor histidine kinase [Nitrososphaerales archaeon]|nr:sensor histidine kinase [Nitrososphaerales archaeon]
MSASFLGGKKTLRNLWTRLSQREIALAFVLIVIAIVLSLATYEYSYSVSADIQNSAIQSIRENAQIEASDSANLLKSDIQQVASNLLLISSSEAVRAGNVSAVTSFLSNAQNTTSSFTQSYAWIDQTGNLLANSNQSLLDSFHQNRINVTDRPYFVGAKETGRLYITNAISARLLPGAVIVMAQPTFSPNHTFTGVIASTIETSSLGALLRNETSSAFRCDLGIIDQTGTILYASHNSSSNIGKNLFDPSYLATLPSNVVGSYVNFWHQSLRSNSSGIGVLIVQGMPRAEAYVPVSISVGSGDNATDLRFATVYVAVNEILPSTQASEIGRLQVFSNLAIILISGSSVVGVMVVMKWNSVLNKTVRQRTKELNKSNKDLRESNAQLQTANEQLKLKDAVQRDFINTAAHELRTPVQPLLGMAEMMQQSMAEEGTQEIRLSRNEVELLARNAKRLRNLTENILDVTRLENQNRVSKKTNFDLNKVIKESVEEFAANPSEKQDMVFLPASEPLMVEADETRIGQVIVNLLSNALKYSANQQGGRIVISVWRQGSEAYVRVKDSGPGIDSEAMPKLFSKFYTKSDSGIGLGLYVSKLIVEASGGRIWAENNQGERGASFIFYVPLADRGKDRLQDNKDLIDNESLQLKESGG